MQSGIQDPADFQHCRQHCRQHCSSQYNACTLWTVSVMKISYYQFNVAHKTQPETAVSESRWDVKFTQTATRPTKDLIANKLKNLQPYHVMFITRDHKILSLNICQMQVCEMTLLKKTSKTNLPRTHLDRNSCVSSSLINRKNTKHKKTYEHNSFDCQSQSCITPWPSLQMPASSHHHSPLTSPAPDIQSRESIW